MQNIITIFTEEKILGGSFPVVTDSVVVKTAVVAGDVVGVSSTNTYGKYDDVTYNTPFAIAYAAAEIDQPCTVILSGEILKSFVKLPTSKEEATKNLLRKISIFIK